MAKLVLGPMLRYVSDTEATIWVETDAPCEVEVLGRRAHTFHVAGHHYAIVALRGLAPGRVHEYEVALDGEVHWPEQGAGWPRSSIRPIPRDGRLKLVFGSCRVAAPHEEPWCLPRDDHPLGREVDALYALAHRMRDAPRETWPDLLLMIGDQVYVDEGAPRTRERIRARRDTRRPPGEEVADFEEYTWLYREAWSDPTIRWLFSTVSSAMVFDDHDVHDDWNTSAAWLRDMRARPWWQERIAGALVSYWIYQHLGNFSPDELERSDLLRELMAADDGAALLHAFALAEDHGADGSRWSFARDFGGVRLIVFDSREGRVLEGPGARDMVDPDEWAWIERHLTGDFDHLLLADTLPLLMPPAFHHVEAWNERVCDGAWGRTAARVGERLRRSLDLEHWAAFRRGFEHLVSLIGEVGAGRRGRPPSTILCLAGDIHHAYLAETAFPRGTGMRSRFWQVVCSPFRNPLTRHERLGARAGNSPAVVAAAKLLARAAGARAPGVRWRLVQQPTFDNQVATLELDGPRAVVRIERTAPCTWREPRLETSLERRLA